MTSSGKGKLWRGDRQGQKVAHSKGIGQFQETKEK
jgi:hypothetical protein